MFKLKAQFDAVSLLAQSFFTAMATQYTHAHSTVSTAPTD